MTLRYFDKTTETLTFVVRNAMCDTKEHIKTEQMADGDNRSLKAAATEAEELKTGVFTPGSKVYAKEEMGEWMRKLMPLLVAPIVVLLSIGLLTGDWRFILVAALVMFMWNPSCALLGWFDIMSKADAIKANYPQQATLSCGRATNDNQATKCDKLTIQYFQMPDHEDYERHAAPPEPVLIDGDRLTHCHLHNNYIVVAYVDPEKDSLKQHHHQHRKHRHHLYIPPQAFQSPSEMTQFYTALLAWHSTAKATT
jgi:hypothetical protein